MLLNEAIEKFKQWRSYKVKSNTVKGYDMILRHFCLFLRNCHIEEIKLDDVTLWLNMMESLGWDTNSFIPKVIALRKFFEFYKRQGYNVLDPWLIPVPRKEYKLPRIASEENYQKLLAVVPKDTKDPRHIRNLSIITMLWDTGARNGEILALNVPDVNLEAMKAIVATEKNRGSKPIREIYWTDETNKNLERWMTKREEIAKRKPFRDPEALFVSICSGALADTAGQRFGIKGVGEMLRRYCNRAGIPYMNAHSFRHHYGREMAKKAWYALPDLMGHASIQSTRPYMALQGTELERAYREGREKWDSNSNGTR